MGQYVDNRESEIKDLIWDGVSTILDETMPLLNEEHGAFDGSAMYSKTLRGKLHQKFFDEIWPNINKQLDSVEEDINQCVDNEVEKAVNKGNLEFIDMEDKYDTEITELKSEIQAYKDGRIGGYKMNKNFGL